ncbi:tripartite tricarboxylate transporter substrate binding protein [Achromobacter xylosoxidans]|uniref:Tripartite tricarboxylate transporter substrate binding protein n=1 Tax=Alcaligenes xylosoxydans xylosoxydans TaxID=85698 RepID=A0A1R1JJM3_ALCXX|nr:tripartite tricarboxylate transporter substrate binding protein [Achromobacter xylosoxidans]OMG75575.1 hypothetical protein BIZ92_18605 [Achromobacter xylosoxidans]BEG74136.1 hypothetical protein HBIAX_01183 [Achromobacter xylosoxidans]
MTDRRQFISALAAGGLGLAGIGAPAPARADAAADYPRKPVRLIVPLSPGSPADVLARVISEGLARDWRQPIVIENRPGATGMIGMQTLTRSAPDGYTMGIIFLTHTVLPQLMAPLPYDTARDTAAVANLVWLYNVLAVPESSPIRNLDQLVAAARAGDNALSYGSGGNGSPAHLIAESFARAANVRLLHVPFRGPAEAVNGLLGGLVTCMFATTPTVAPFVRAGKLRALAVTSPRRLPSLPDIPTLAESGMPGLELREWEGVVAPAGTPPPIIDKWNAALSALLRDRQVIARLQDLGMTAAEPNRPQDFSGLIQRELAHWQDFSRKSPLRTS